MEQQNKYYTPDAGDFCIGYCNYEIFSEGEWTKQPPLENSYDFNEVYDLFNEGKTVTNLRTKSLDQSDIESLGWIYKEDSFHRKLTEEKGKVYVPTHYWFTKPDTKMTLTWYPGIKVHIEECDITFMLPSIKYSGECKSINELRLIQKFIGI